MEREIVIEGVKIGRKYPPFVVAEMSGNHNQSIDKALAIVRAAAEAGVNALKLQTYTPDTITLDVKNDDFFVKDSKSLWKGSYLYELYQQSYTPWEWHKPIIERCKQLGLICFSTPFDESSVDFLETLNVPCYKIASFENNHLPLLRRIAVTGKPVIISTGLARVSELHEAVETLRSHGTKDIILLKCTSSYPADPINANILTIPHMRELFGCKVGLSDHTLGIGVSVASVVLGTTFIEKHFTLSRSDGGIDSEFSLEPEEMKALVVETKRAWQSLGKVSYEFSEKEKNNLQFRRSIYISKDLKSGDILTKENLRVVRPGYGLHPRYFEQLIGKKVSCNLKKGTAVNWDLIVN
ncbi:pseudaminic acid synthase [Candidatus Dependentiae bacterium]|nr:pseudaminic acid synthase [Candidatus Dependentiae bacterium]